MEPLLILALLSTFLLIAEAVNSYDPESVYKERRLYMVEEQIASRGVSLPELLKAMSAVPRHKFLPEYLSDIAYSDAALPIGMGQTVSEPYVTALMTELLNPVKGQRVLEIGTGSGYQAAILAEMGAEVYTVEILEPLSLFARSNINSLGYPNVHFKTGDGYLGWEEHAPYDAVLITGAPPGIPGPLKNQLREGGRMVMPAGGMQGVLLLTKRKDGFDEERIAPAVFKPMTGESEKHLKRD